MTKIINTIDKKLNGNIIYKLNKWLKNNINNFSHINSLTFYTSIVDKVYFDSYSVCFVVNGKFNFSTQEHDVIFYEIRYSETVNNPWSLFIQSAKTIELEYGFKNEKEVIEYLNKHISKIVVEDK